MRPRINDRRNQCLLIQVSDNTDWAGLALVYNHFVHESTAAYPSKPVESDFFKKKWSENKEYPFYEVFSDENVIGFGYIAPFHPADSMQGTAALTYFLLPEFTGNGIGTELLQRLMNEGQVMGITNYIASISSDNLGSINFHSRNGFTECGRFRAVGNKNGRIFDMVWMQRITSPHDTA